MRPWIDTNGKWYATIATDGCNATTKKVPCAKGGQADLWVNSGSELYGKNANWEQITPLFTSPQDVLPGVFEQREFVTPEYFGSVPGDPQKGNTTRVFTNNGADSGTTMYFLGEQSNGSPFVPLPSPNYCTPDNMKLARQDFRGAFSHFGAQSGGHRPAQGRSTPRIGPQRLCIQRVAHDL